MSPFLIKQCAITAVSAGKRACNLLELRDLLIEAPLDSIYYHFWGRRLAPHYTIADYHNDFALWAHKSLKDDFLYEQFNILDPDEYKSWELLKQNLIEVVEKRLDTSEKIWIGDCEPFHLIQPKLVIFKTTYKMEAPEELLMIFNKLSLGTIFYHFIDVYFRTAENDLIEWLKSYGEKYGVLIEKLKAVDPYFFSLSELKAEINKIIEGYFHGSSRKI